LFATVIQCANSASVTFALPTAAIEFEGTPEPQAPTPTAVAIAAQEATAVRIHLLTSAGS
jgi:hypothetical protein